jgi:CBS domain-containing protein
MTARPRAPVSPSPAPTVLAGLKIALRSHAPFAAMTDEDVERLVRASRLAYFAPGETILAPGPERPMHCYVIKQGAVRGERPRATGSAGDAVALWEIAAGDMFPLGALLARRGVTSVYRATRDTFCVVFPAATFDSLVAQSPPFGDFCTRRLAHLLDLSRAGLQAEYAARVTGESGMATRLSDLMRTAPVTVSSPMPVGDALATMESRRIGSLPVVDPEGHPLGIFTRQDVVGRIVLPQLALTTAIGDVMSTPAITLPEVATAADAALLMAQHGIRHVVVTDDDDRVAGVVSERDLFSLQRLSVREIASALRRARDLPALVQCAADIRGLSYALVAQGVGSGTLTRMISRLNDQLTHRAVDLTARDFDLSGLGLCWLGMGSEGREEQTIATDQDNGLIFAANDATAPAARMRERLLAFAQAVNETLDRCGYPLCKGHVMAGNPRWCLSLPEWRAAFAQWIDRGDPDSLLTASIFFDFRSLWGRAELAHALRTDIAARARANPRFLKQMTDNALRNRPPLSWRGELKANENAPGGEGIDLKMSGSMPLTDGARIFALETGVVATNTIERLLEAGARKGIADGNLRSWCDAFGYLQMLRLRTQHRRAERELGASANPNLLPLASISDLDRRILMESLRQVRKLQQRLELDYP